MRHADAHASAAFIGANVEILPYKDAELQVTEEAAWMVADLIRKYRPNVLITHWNGSFHPDHNNTHEIVRKSLFKASLPAFKRELPPHSIRALLYSENWEDMDELLGGYLSGRVGCVRGLLEVAEDARPDARKILQLPLL